MQTVHKASELSADERQVVERLLGRALGENEAFRLSAPVGAVIKEAPRGAAKEEAASQLKEHMERMRARTQDVSEEELNDAIDAALAEVRQMRP